jgi:membrane protein
MPVKLKSKEKNLRTSLSGIISVAAFKEVFALCKVTVTNFIKDDSLSRGAAIAFFAVTSMAPLLLVLTAVAGMAFGETAARGAIVTQLSGIAGPESASFFEGIIKSASVKSSGVIATLIGTVTLIITISGVFGEMQSALNAIWKVQTTDTTVSRLLRARAASFGLVVALGFLLMTSLALSAALAAFGDYIKLVWTGYEAVLGILNFVISLVLIAVLFGAIFKVLPDRSLQWKDVVIGAITSALLFSAGKYLIAAYLASSGIATTYGAAGALILLLLWVYYSVQIFLLGAEFTKAYAQRFGSRKNQKPLKPKVVPL